MDFFVRKINISLAYRYVGKIAVWMQIIRNEKTILESEKYNTGFGDTKLNILFEENNIMLRELRRGDRIRFRAGLLDGGWQKSISCSFQVSLQVKHYQYGKSLHVTKQDKFNTPIERKGYSEYKSPGIFLECPDVEDCLPRVDSLRLLCVPSNSDAGDTYFGLLISYVIL